MMAILDRVMVLLELQTILEQLGLQSSKSFSLLSYVDLIAV